MRDVFRNLGFSEREIKVYLALLELGETTVGPVAARTHLQHSKVYPTLDKLLERGLVTFVVKSKTKHFLAQPPRRILALLKERERGFKEVLPALEQKQALSQSPQTARVYEGYRGIKSMFETILEEVNSKSFYFVFAFRDEYLDSPLASRFLRNVHLELSKQRVDDRLIANPSIKENIIATYAGIPLIKYRFTRLAIPLGLMVVNDRVINWVWGERPTAIEIISRQIAQQYKKFFLDVWKRST